MIDPFQNLRDENGKTLAEFMQDAIKEFASPDFVPPPIEPREVKDSEIKFWKEYNEAKERHMLNLKPK